MLMEEARMALRAGREDVARLALQRRRMTIAEIEVLDQRVSELQQAAARVDARTSALDRLVTASLSEVPAHSSAPAGRYPIRMDGDQEIERQLRGLLQEQQGREEG